MVGAVVAAAAAVGTLAVTGYEAYAGSKQASAANKVANTQLGMEQDLYGQQQQYRDELSSLLADPSSVTSLPGYEFQKGQGEESVTRQFAANPSGAEGVALTEFGQNYASSAYTTQANLLAGLSGLTQSPAAYGSNAVNGTNAATSAQGQSFEQIMQALAQGGATAKLFGPQGNFGSAGTPINPASTYSGNPGYTPVAGGGMNA